MRKTFAAVAILAAFGSIAAIPAAAQGGFAWAYNRFTDFNGQPVRVLSYSVPQTDNVQFAAQCQTGPGGQYAAIDLGANIGNIPGGQTVLVNFNGAGFQRTIAGTIVRPDGEGVSGVRIDAELNDPLWQGIAALARLTYDVTGLPPATLALNGSGAPTRQFLSECANPAVAAPAPPPLQPLPVPTPALAAGGATSCRMLGTLRSPQTGPTSVVTFINGSNSYRSILWVDANGVIQNVTGLNPGQSQALTSVRGSVWMIADGPGNCIELFIAPTGPSQYVTTAAGGNFGPE